MMLVTLISYVDRNTLAILAPTILHDTHLSAEQYGVIISCFSFAYMAGNPLWGRILDRFGLRGGMSVAVGIWTAASAAHAWAGGFAGFALARFALGSGESATYPGGARTVAQTLSPSKRGRGLAVAYSGTSLGAMLTPLIVTPIALRYGWHGAFLFTGLIGALWLAFWRLTSRDIDRGVDFAPHPIPWRVPALWGFMAIYGIGATPLAFILYDSSLYLTSRFHWSQGTLGEVLWIPPLGLEAGYFFWGWALDRLGSQYVGRMVLVLVLLAVPFAWTHSLSSGPLVMASMFLMMFVVGGLSVVALASATRTFSWAHTGLLGGLGAGSFGAVTTLIMPTFGRLFDQGRYETAFRLAASLPLTGYIAWRLLIRRSTAQGQGS
jgi:ACS family hexuronate transporter-like MFS transporter